jgi:hypothetical protein
MRLSTSWTHRSHVLNRQLEEALLHDESPQIVEAAYDHDGEMNLG